MSKKYDHPLMKKANAAANSGVCFIGSPLDNFHLIIRCPIHVYCQIKKALTVMPNVPASTFYSGSMPISDLAASRFIGTFIYRSPQGKAKKFQAAFIYPTCCAFDECDINPILSIHQCFEHAGYEFYNKQNKSIPTIVAENYPGSLLLDCPDLENFLCSF